MTKYITIICAKGGVGKTTTTINLASALLFFGRNVIAIDADLTAPNMSIHLGVPNLSCSIHDALDGKMPLSSYLYYHQSGLRIIPGNIAYESTKGINLNNFKTILRDLDNKAEIVLVDGAPGVSSESQTIIDAVDFVVPITTPDLAAISDARKTVRMAQEKQKKVLGVIVNRVRGEEQEIDIHNIEAFLDAPVIGVIPEESCVRTSYHLKGPIVYTHPDSDVAQAYKKIAARLVGEEYHFGLEQKKVPSFGREILAGFGIVKKE